MQLTPREIDKLMIYTPVGCRFKTQSAWFEAKLSGSGFYYYSHRP
ncbi:Uncharacterised protein [Budvicia aquatica]|uniref:Uncharacterized protein n=1 Tax=Budvicia aquatica TaxID=82979 RepID=A0A484ZFD5_9GAMM|nr:Uncharacterised protein [Budvicia aquatica]